MAVVKYAGNILRGLSTDIKPTNVSDGTLFIETDTLKILTFSGSVYNESKSDAVKLNGINISSTPPTNGQILVFNGITNQWEPQSGGGGGGISNAYVKITDGTNEANASGQDTFKFRSSDSSVSIIVTDNDPTHGDNVNLIVNSAMYQATSEKGVANGYCELDSSAKVPVSRLTEIIDLSKLTDVGDVQTGRAKGDILVCDGTSYQRLSIGADGLVLTADSTQPLGVRWDVGGGGGGGLSSAYVKMTDGIHDAVASGPDTFKFRSSDNSVLVTVTNNDPTHQDNVDLVVNSTMYQAKSEKGIANGYCELDAGSKVPISKVDEVLGLNNLFDVSFTGTVTTGDLLYRTSTGWDRLAIGANGQVLAVFGGLPTWQSPNAYVIMTDGTNNANASGVDTFKFRSANNILSIVITDNDPIHGDNVLFTVNQGNIDHNSLSNLTIGDPHTQYQLRSEKGAANGYCELDSSSKVPSSRITEVIGLNGLSDVSFTGDVATGDLLYRTSTGWNRLAIGTNGQVLTVSGGLPTWQNPSAGGGSGTINFIPVFINSMAMGNSILYQQPTGTQFTGIGISTGASVGAALHILKDGTTSNSLTNAQIKSEGYSTVNDVGIQFFRARGTKTAPSAILTNDILGFIEFHGHFGTGFDRGARIVASAPGTWSASSKPVDFVIEVVQSVSPFNKTPRFKILSDGSFEFRDSAASVIMPLKSNGVLGLKHSSGAAVPTINFFDGTIYSNTGIYSLSSGTVLGFSVSGTSYAEFSSSQFKLQTGIKLYIQYSGTASNPSILINNVGFFSPIAGNLSVTIGNTERYRFSNVGNLVMMGDYNFIPNTTGQGKVGTFTNKFAEVNAVVVNSGDFRFDNGYYLTEDYENGGIKLCRPDGSVVTSWR